MTAQHFIAIVVAPLSMVAVCLMLAVWSRYADR